MIASTVVVVGASAGGVKAIQQLFGTLPPNFRLPVVIVQHLPKDSNTDLELVYGHQMPKTMKAVSIEDKTAIESGKIYFAPPGYHTLVERGRFFSLTQDEPVHYSRPSIDVTFESAAQALGSSVIGVLMTGANEDGAAGLHEIYQHGGLTMVQDPNTAEVATMPEAALRLFKPWRVASVEGIGHALGEFANGVAE